MGVSCIALRKSKPEIVSGSDDWSLRTWNINENKELYNFITVDGSHKSRISCISITDDEILFSGSYDRTIK